MAAFLHSFSAGVMSVRRADSGGLDLKSSPRYMKGDMGGAAAVLGAFESIVKMVETTGFSRCVFSHFFASFLPSLLRVNLASLLDSFGVTFWRHLSSIWRVLLAGRCSPV